MNRILGAFAVLAAGLFVAVPVAAQVIVTAMPTTVIFDVARVVDVQRLRNRLAAAFLAGMLAQPVTYRTADRYYGPRDKTPAVLGDHRRPDRQPGRPWARTRSRHDCWVALGAAAAHDSQKRNGGYYQAGRTVRAQRSAAPSARITVRIASWSAMTSPMTTRVASATCKPTSIRATASEFASTCRRFPEISTTPNSSTTRFGAWAVRFWFPDADRR